MNDVTIQGDINLPFKMVEMVFPKYAKAALYAGASVLKNQATANLISRVPNASTPGPVFYDTLVDAIRNTKSLGDEVKIHILGTRQSGSGTFRTRFFENGTRERFQKTINGKKLKRPKSIGRIKATHFFQDAVSASQQQVSMAMQNILDNFFKRYG